MAIITFTSTERPVGVDMQLSPCCGQVPEVTKWNRKALVGIYCRNPKCENHPNGVLCYDDQQDIQTRWEKFRKKEATTN